MRPDFDIKKLILKEDRTLVGYKNPNFYCVDAAYEDKEVRRECCFFNCTVELNYVNEKNSDFCYAHKSQVANILSEVPLKHYGFEWMYYYNLEKKRGNIYGIRPQDIMQDI